MKMHNIKRNSMAIVIGLSINALGIIRSLGRKSIDVIALNPDKSDYVAKSRYCQVVYCNKLYGKGLVDQLIKIGQSIKKEKVLFCTSDLSVLTISKHRERLKQYYQFVLPTDDTVKKLMNKKLFHEFAVQNNFSVPKTLFVHDEKDIDSVGYKTSYPCLIKPAYHEKNWENHVSKRDKILHVKSRNEFFNFFRNYNLSNNPLIVQEWIEGSDEDVFYCLAYINRKKEPAALFTGKKIRQYPVLTGSTSVAEGKRNAHVSEQSAKLLKTAGCIGICSVEFKYSKKDDVYYITEPTVGRTDTQEGSGIDAGMDIPYIAYLDALGYDHEPVMYFREGIKWINEPEDYNSVSMYLKRREISLRELMASYRGKRTYALSAIDDPLPFITFLCQKVKRRIFRNNYNPN